MVSASGGNATRRGPQSRIVRIFLISNYSFHWVATAKADKAVCTLHKPKINGLLVYVDGSSVTRFGKISQTLFE
jgi:predicted secreted Zn-dependent protease